MAYPLGFRPVETRETFWILDPSVDYERIAPEVIEEYFRSGDTAKIPLHADKEPPTRIRYRALTAEERARVDAECLRVERDGVGSQPRLREFPQLRLVLAFAVGADVPDLSDPLALDGGTTAPKWIDDAHLGVRRLHPRAVDHLAAAMGLEALYHVGRLILAGSEATAADRFRDHHGGPR